MVCKSVLPVSMIFSTTSDWAKVLPVVSIKPEKRNKVKRLRIGKSPWKLKLIGI